MTNKEKESDKILKTREQLRPFAEYRFIRLDDVFGFEKINSLAQKDRTHRNLALETKLFRDKTPVGKPIVSDGGRMIMYKDHVELAVDWTATTQVERLIGFDMYKPKAKELYDAIERPLRMETAQKLANLLGIAVLMRYQPVFRGATVEEYRFESRPEN